MKKFLTTAAALLAVASFAAAQDAVQPAASPKPAATAETERVVVQSEELDISREQIVPSLGATRYTVGPDRLDSQAQGENASLLSAAPSNRAKPTRLSQSPFSTRTTSSKKRRRRSAIR